MKPKAANFQIYKPEHEMERLKIEKFIKEFIDNCVDEHISHGKKKYMIELVLFFINFLQKRILNYFISKEWQIKSQKK